DGIRVFHVTGVQTCALPILRPLAVQPEKVRPSEEEHSRQRRQAGELTVAKIKRDPVTGKETTGHEWNGIEELDSPVPKVVLLFLAATIIFSVACWILLPTFPLGKTYTKGVLGTDQRKEVAQKVAAAQAQRQEWASRIESMSYEQIMADPELMKVVKQTGHTLFQDNCAACHGMNATGGPGFPDLTAKKWLWGGTPEQIAETIKV